MTADRWAQLEDLIEPAFSGDPERRAAAIAACPNDELRAELERLIREYDDLGSFMEGSPVRSVALKTRTISQEGLRAGQILKGCYRIVRLLGKGGMGEVYEAEDLQLEGCRIALKTLRSGLPSGGRTLERFKRETLLARRVTHPNVCRVYHLDRDTREDREDLVFLTMEFLDGETLYQRIKRLGPMDAATADPVARGIMAGLAACHKRGIVHRDFKSGNVMLVRDEVEGPRAVITDFGLAHTPEGSDGPVISIPGGIMGTPEYMAPEQKDGKPATAASDIYALGIVLCEMLTGHRPADGPVPPPENAWAAVIERCLQPDPAARFSSAVELEQSLAGPPPAPAVKRRRRWLAAAACVFILALLAGWAAYRKVHSLPEQKHVAILAFQNLGKNPADQVFCEGLAETLTSKLSQLERYQKSFWVVPASESRQAADPHEAYRKLDATLVVTGTLERMPGKTVLLVNLIDPRTRRQLASRDIPTTADLSGLEDDAWQRVADMLDLQLGPAQVQAVDAGRARVPAAYVAYAQGVGYARRAGPEDIVNAIARFEEAIRLDPSYGLAQSGLGSAYELKYEQTQEPQWLDLARTAAQKAADLAPDLAQVHLTLGQMDFREGKDEEAERELKRALALDPDVVEAHFYLGRLHGRANNIAEAERDFRSAVARRPEYWRAHSELGIFEFGQGHLAEAEHESAEALRVQPDQPWPMTNLGGIYMATGRYEDAVQILNNAIRFQPNNGTAYSDLGAAYMFLGKFAKAVEPMERAVRLRPGLVDLWRNLGDSYQFAPGQAGKAPGAYRQALALARRQLLINPKDWDAVANVALFDAHLNNRAEALQLAEQSSAMAPSNNNVLFTSALVYELLGKRSAAIEALSAAHANGCSLDDIQHEPVLAALHTDPRYQVWLRQVKK